MPLGTETSLTGWCKCSSAQCHFGRLTTQAGVDCNMSPFFGTWSQIPGGGCWWILLVHVGTIPFDIQSRFTVHSLTTFLSSTSKQLQTGLFIMIVLLGIFYGITSRFLMVAFWSYQVLSCLRWACDASASSTPKLRFVFLWDHGKSVGDICFLLCILSAICTCTEKNNMYICQYVYNYICQYVYMSICIYIYICAYMHYVYFHYHHYPCHHYHYHHHHHHHHPHHQHHHHITIIIIIIIIIITIIILHIVHSIHIYSMGLDHGFLVFGSTWWFET